MEIIQSNPCVACYFLGVRLIYAILSMVRGKDLSLSMLKSSDGWIFWQNQYLRLWGGVFLKQDMLIVFYAWALKKLLCWPPFIQYHNHWCIWARFIDFGAVLGICQTFFIDENILFMGNFKEMYGLCCSCNLSLFGLLEMNSSSITGSLSFF